MDGSLFSDFCLRAIIVCVRLRIGGRLGILRSPVWNKCCDSYHLSHTLIQGVVTFFQDKMLKSFSVSNKSLYFDIRNCGDCVLNCLYSPGVCLKLLCSCLEPLKHTFKKYHEQNLNKYFGYLI